MATIIAACRPHATSDYRPDIDGLRAISVLAVIFYHSGIWPFSGGFVGVDLFFVISGYLIGGIIHREIQAGSFGFLAFYARRARRILPALLAVVAVSLAVGTVIFTASELIGLAANARAAVLGLANIWLWRYQGYFSPAAELQPLLMSWSLGVEEQFYLLYPAAIFLLSRFRLPLFSLVLAGTLLSFALSVVLTPRMPGAAFYMLPTRGWELGIGTLLAIAEYRRGRPLLDRAPWQEIGAVAGVALIAASILFLRAGTDFPGYLALIPASGAALLIAGENGRVRRLLSAAPLVFLGLISYSLYLWHWPVLSFMRIIANRHPIVHFQDLTGPELCFAFSLIFILSVLSFLLIERPFRRRRARPFPTLLGYAAVVFLAAGGTTAILLMKGLPQRYPDVAAFDSERQTTMLTRDCFTLYGSADLPTLPRCYGADGPRFAIVGDSHAAVLAPGLRRALAQRGGSLVQLTKASCPPFLGTTMNRPDIPDHPRECAAFNRRALDAIAADPRIHTVFLAAIWSSPWNYPDHAFVATDRPALRRAELQGALLVAGVRNEARFLADHGKRVIILGDTPYYDSDPAVTWSTTRIPVRRWLTSLMARNPELDGLIPRTRTRTDVTEAFLSQAASGVPGARMVSLKAAFCESGYCRTQAGDLPLYIDMNHLSETGADRAAAWLARQGLLDPPAGRVSPQAAAATPRSAAR